MAKQTEEVRMSCKKIKWGFPIISLTVGAVLAGSDNRGVKALGAGMAVAATLSLLNKLAELAD